MTKFGIDNFGFCFIFYFNKPQKPKVIERKRINESIEIYVYVHKTLDGKCIWVYQCLLLEVSNRKGYIYSFLGLNGICSKSVMHKKVYCREKFKDFQ